MRVLLTGATGFLGKRVLKQLLAEDADAIVRCTVRSEQKLDELQELVGADNWHRIETVEADLSKPAGLNAVVRGCDVVYHVAAALSGCASSLFLNTVVPTRSLMTAAADAGAGRFVLISSLGVYGSQSLPKQSVLDESCPIDARPQARDPYTFSKVVQEEVAQQISRERDLPLVIVRPGVIFGDERGVLSHRIGLQLGGIMLRMGGAQRVPFTYVENCAAAVVKAGLVEQAAGQIINIVDDNLPTGRDVIRRYRKAGRKLRVIGIPQFAIGLLAKFNEWYSRHSNEQIPAVLTQHRVQAMWKPLRYSNEKAKRLLGWTPQIDWATAFDRSLGS